MEAYSLETSKVIPKDSDRFGGSIGTEEEKHSSHVMSKPIYVSPGRFWDTPSSVQEIDEED